MNSTSKIKHLYSGNNYLIPLLAVICFLLPFSSRAQTCVANFGFQTNRLTVTFTDSSTGNPANYLWLFGDGSSDIVQNPTHTYQHDGDYPVRLIISGIGCQDTAFKRVCINCVWPGDANNDGIVNNKDALYVGLAYGAVGPVRPNSSTGFTGVSAAQWVSPNGPANFQSGPNFKHADCDGNGRVDEFDLQVIRNNYNSVSHKQSGSKCLNLDDPPLYFEVLDSIPVGSSVDVAVKLGDNLIPALDVYGIAYTIHYDGELIDTGTVQVDYDNSLFGSPTDIIYLNKNFHGNGALETAVSRIDHNNIDVAGTIAVMSFIMEDNLAQKTFLTDVLNLSFSDILLIQNDETTVPVCAWEDSAIVVQKVEDIPSSIPNHQDYFITVYPNPARDKLLLEAKGSKENQIRLTNLLGKDLYHATLQREGIHSIDVSGVSGGIYFLIIENELEQRTLMIEVSH